MSRGMNGEFDVRIRQFAERSGCRPCADQAIPTLRGDIMEPRDVVRRGTTANQDRTKTKPVLLAQGGLPFGPAKRRQRKNGLKRGIKRCEADQL